MLKEHKARDTSRVQLSDITYSGNCKPLVHCYKEQGTIQDQASKTWRRLRSDSIKYWPKTLFVFITSR